MRLTILIILILFICIYINKINEINEIQGIDPYGVVAYINEESDKKNYIDGHFTGLQWQCIEYARRWLLQMKGITFGNVDNAEDLWKLTYINETYEFTNVIYGIPPIGALLIYKKTKKNPFGHVAVVVNVHQNGEVDLAEQNFSKKKWKGSYSRRINIKDPDIIGWKIIKSKSTLKSLP